MKKIFYLFVTIILASCGNGTSIKTNAPADRGDNENRIEVLYFYGKQRCITCRAIEKHTKDLLDTLYSKQLADGKIVYKSIDISQKENEAIADKYEVTWSSLFINLWKEGKEETNNMTDFAFSYAKGQAEVFKEGIREKIEELRAQ